MRGKWLLARRIAYSFCRVGYKGSAFPVYQAILQARANITYPQLCQELSARFNPPQHTQLHEAEFRRAQEKVQTKPKLSSLRLFSA